MIHDDASEHSASAGREDMTSLENRRTATSPESGDHRVRQAAHISAAWCGDEVVLLDATTGRYYTINHVGGCMWELLTTPKSADDVIQCLSTTYDVPPDARGATLRSDVVRMLDNMLGAGLLIAESPADLTQSSNWSLRR